jgi:hypothetical protein
VYVWDRFNRINNSSLGSAVIGGSWQSNIGSWTISNNAAVTTANPNANVTINVPGILNGQLKTDFIFGATAEASLTFLDDGLNRMVLLYKKNAVTSQVGLYSLIGSVAAPGVLPAPVATFNFAPTNSALLKVVINGNVIQVWRSAVLLITYGLKPGEIAKLKDPGSNRVGFWAESDSLTRFDTVRFQSLVP